jgi:galactokinase
MTMLAHYALCCLLAPVLAFSIHHKSIMIPSRTSLASSHFSNELPSIQSLVEQAKGLHHETFLSEDGLVCTVAPGRVNLIGEHTDYSQGFVFPMAIGFSTVCIGTGSIVEEDKAECKVISVNANPPKTITFESSHEMNPLPTSDPDSWSNYVAGVVNEYMKVLPEKTSICLEIAVCGDVPLGSGLSSSAALEVAVATFIETIIKKKFPDIDIGGKKEKALRCQKAENIFCNSPCGIMDQYVSSIASEGSAILIDCRSLEYESVQMGSSDDGEDGEMPVFLICNSDVKHSIGGGEYPVRVKQCADATKILKSLCGETIESLRDATLDDVEMAHKKRKDGETPLMDDLIYRRAKHVVTENTRTQDAKKALIDGDWKLFGRKMNESHESMKVDYEVSCEEIDFLADTAQKFEGVYGSRLTGGGFGGCTVTMVKRSRVKALCEHLKAEYKSVWGKDCPCFETVPGPGARELIL